MAKPLIPHASFVRLLKAAAASKRVSEDEVIDTELADWLDESPRVYKKFAHFINMVLTCQSTSCLIHPSTPTTQGERDEQTTGTDYAGNDLCTSRSEEGSQVDLGHARI